MFLTSMSFYHINKRILGQGFKKKLNYIQVKSVLCKLFCQFWCSVVFVFTTRSGNATTKKKNWVAEMGRLG